MGLELRNPAVEDKWWWQNTKGRTNVEFGCKHWRGFVCFLTAGLMRCQHRVVIRSILTANSAFSTTVTKMSPVGWFVFCFGENHHFLFKLWWIFLYHYIPSEWLSPFRILNIQTFSVWRVEVKSCWPWDAPIRNGAIVRKEGLVGRQNSFCYLKFV